MTFNDPLTYESPNDRKEADQGNTAPQTQLVPIKHLPLPHTIKRLLIHAGYSSLDDLDHASDTSLLKIRGMGTTALQKIRMLLEQQTAQDRVHADIPTVVAQPADSQQGNNPPMLSSRALPRLMIQSLDLSTRTLHTLRRHGIWTIDHLAALSVDDLAAIKDMGSKSITEIQQALHSINIAELCEQAHGYHEQGKHAALITIDPLLLLSSTVHMLRQQNVSTIADLVQYVQHALKNPTGSTIKLDELQMVLHVYGLTVEREPEKSSQSSIAPANQSEPAGFLRNVSPQLIERLSRRSKMIIIWRYGLHGHTPRTLAAIAKDVHLTSQRVRQILQKALIALQEACSLPVIEAFYTSLEAYLLEWHGLCSIVELHGRVGDDEDMTVEELRGLIALLTTLLPRIEYLIAEDVVFLAHQSLNAATIRTLFTASVEILGKEGAPLPNDLLIEQLHQRLQTTTLLPLSLVQRCLSIHPDLTQETSGTWGLKQWTGAYTDTIIAVLRDQTQPITNTQLMTLVNQRLPHPMRSTVQSIQYHIRRYPDLFVCRKSGRVTLVSLHGNEPEQRAQNRPSDVELRESSTHITPSSPTTPEQTNTEDEWLKTTITAKIVSPPEIGEMSQDQPSDIELRQSATSTTPSRPTTTPEQINAEYERLKAAIVALPAYTPPSAKKLSQNRPSDIERRQSATHTTPSRPTTTPEQTTAQHDRLKAAMNAIPRADKKSSEAKKSPEVKKIPVTGAKTIPTEPITRATLLKKAIELLKDGKPRLGREIMDDLIAQGVMGITKTMVNSVLSHEGRSAVIYNRRNYTYTLRSPRIGATIEEA